ncbi:hypothetical protein RKD49_001055 [Streptomyces glaucescens]
MDGAWTCESCGREAPASAQKCRVCGSWLPPFLNEDERPWWRRRRRRSTWTEPPPESTVGRPVVRDPTVVTDARTDTRTDTRTDHRSVEPPRPVRQPPPSLVHTGGGTIEGVAQNVRMRTEVDEGSGSTVVCDFRVEIQERRSGTPLRLVAVEMRGDRFDGAVHDGDWVRATGEFKRGTLRVRRLRNLTTGAEVSVGRTNVVAITVIVVLFVAYMVFLFGFVGR